MRSYFLKIFILVLVAILPIPTLLAEEPEAKEPEPVVTSYFPESLPETIPLLEGALPPVPSAETEPLGPILSVSFSGLHAYSEEVARDLVSLDVGEILTRQKLENSINTLRKWGVFVDVEVLVEYLEEGIRLTYEVKEGYIIKDISISGNYPLLDRQVKRTLFLVPGQIYDNAKLPEQLDRLAKLYEQEGFKETSVLAIEDYDEPNREVKLKLKIEKGITYRLRNYDVKGNTFLNPRRIRTIIFTYSHYKPRTIKKDLKKIQNIYKKKGFVRARVRLEGEHYDREAKKVDIEVLIRQGDRIKVVFSGDKHFSNRKLKKNITLYEDGDFDEFELEASRKKLDRFYRERGFEEVQISVEKEKIADHYYQITFNINSGPQREVKKIEIQGNEAIEDDKLKDLIQTKESKLFESGYYLPELFEADLKAIQGEYRREGYLNAHIEKWDKQYITDKKVKLTVHVNEDGLAKVQNLQIDGLPDARKQDVFSRLQCRPGNPYSMERLEEDIQLILLNLSNHGYPYAKVTQDTKRAQDQLYNIHLQVNLGEHVTIGRVLFVGNALTDEKTLRRNMRFKEGDEFSTQKILQSELNIRRLGAFDAVSVETLGLANLEKVVHSVVRVQEKKSKILDLEAGYNTDEGFHGELIYNKLNMFGSGKNGNIKLRGGQEIGRVEVNYIDPRLYGTSLQFLSGIFAGVNRRPFFEDFEAGAFGTLFKNFSTHLSASTRMDFEYIDFNESKTIAAELGPRESGIDSTILTTNFQVTYDARDNFGNPKKGYFLNGGFSISNQFIQASGNYFTLESQLGYWYSPMSRITFANAFRVAKIIPVPSGTVVPADDLLYLGGDDTVRGFDQDAILPQGGLFSMVYNLELQMRIFGNFLIVGFLDTGVDVVDISSVSPGAFRFGAGPGIRYATPVGPIRLDYGFNLDPNPGEPRSRLHFTFGYFF